jgi:hypothetical protein
MQRFATSDLKVSLNKLQSTVSEGLKKFTRFNSQVATTVGQKLKTNCKQV